jgi:hypothetical protein
MSALSPTDLHQLLSAVYRLQAQAQRLIDGYVRGEARAEEQQALDGKVRIIDDLLVKLAGETNGNRT